MIIIDNNVVGAAFAFAGGAVIAVICYILSKRMLKKQAGLYASMQIVRQVIQVGYLVVLWLLASKSPWDPVWMLVGGCLGITLPMFYFTYKLVKQNDSMNKKEEDKTDG